MFDDPNWFALFWFGWTLLTLVATVAAVRESNRRRPDPPPRYSPQVRCLACGDRYPIDETELHLLLQHTRHERTDR